MLITSFYRRALVLSLGLSLLQIVPAQTSTGALPIAVEVPHVVSRSSLLGHTDTSRILHVSVSLPYADPAGAQAFADSVSDPGNVSYRHFISPEEIGARYGLSPSQVQAVKDYLGSKGFQIKLVSKNRLSILADCTVAQAESAFHTVINDYRANSSSEPGNRNYFSFSKPLQMPKGIAPCILDVSGLESFTRPQHRALTPTLTRVLYNTAPMYNSGLYGQGRTVGISNWDGFRLSNVSLYYSHFALPTPVGGVGSNITDISISGGSGGGQAGAEGDLDIQMVLGMAPLCNLIIYDNGGGSDLIGVLSREANDNVADVITESYGWSIGSTTASSAHNLHVSMSSEGITYMAASGDSGTSLEPYSYPDYEPEVLSVGGTVASVDSSGNRLSEVGWSGSGGGWSTNTASFNVLPSWQHGTGVPTNINKRLVPDIGLHASSSTGAYQFYYNGSLTSAYIGTSFACPVFGGMLAVSEQSIINQGGLPADGLGHHRFGRIQDLVYSQNGRSDVWYDITSGSNGTLPNGSSSNAGPGWDFVTGFGAMNMNAFVATQVSTTPDFTISASPSSQSVVQGSSAGYTVTVTGLNGYSGTVGLSVSGLPSGAGATFNPTSITGSGSSTLTITTSSSTPTGSYPLTITGSDGTTTHSTSVTLVVTAPLVADFSMSTSPGSRSIKRGRSTTFTTTVTALNGFTGTVTMSVTGLPANASGTFNPTSIVTSGSTVLTISTSSSTSRGSYSLTITGTSGSLTHSNTVTLQVR